MKRAYWFLLLFGIWCAICGVWYLVVMKGIKTDPHFFEPHISIMAILEILLMLLIACLLGYAIAWNLREEPIQLFKENIEELEADQKTMLTNNREKDDLLRQSNEQLAQLKQTLTIRVNKAKQETASLQKELSDLELQLVQAKEMPEVTSYNQSENEAGGLRYRIKQLEYQNQELEETQRKLQQELQESLAKQVRRSPESIHPFVRPAEIDEKDDLTMIKGIGAFIEKRLNMIGIYTYRQISELTPEMIDHVTKAIEFFPNRIKRDDWVGQAAKYL